MEAQSKAGMLLLDPCVSNNALNIA